jgi:hypothetical protein
MALIGLAAAAGLLLLFFSKRGSAASRPSIPVPALPPPPPPPSSSSSSPGADGAARPPALSTEELERAKAVQTNLNVGLGWLRQALSGLASPLSYESLRPPNWAWQIPVILSSPKLQPLSVDGKIGQKSFALATLLGSLFGHKDGWQQEDMIGATPYEVSDFVDEILANNDTSSVKFGQSTRRLGALYYNLQRDGRI